MVTLNESKTVWMGLATATELLPAKSSPTALGASSTSSTIKEPESPPAITAPWSPTLIRPTTTATA